MPVPDLQELTRHITEGAHPAPLAAGVVGFVTGGTILGEEALGALRAQAQELRRSGVDLPAMLAEIGVLGSALNARLVEALRGRDDIDAAGAAEICARLQEGLSAATVAAAAAFREVEVEAARKLVHDLKNPIGAAESAAHLIQDEEAIAGDPTQRKHFLAIVVRNLLRARNLAEEVRRLVAPVAAAAAEPGPEAPGGAPEGAGGAPRQPAESSGSGG
jgi:hypothetical protein